MGGNGTAKNNFSSSNRFNSNLTTQTPQTNSYFTHKNRLSLLYVVISFLSSSFIYNWPAAQEFLVYSRAYEWLCKPDLNSSVTVNCDLQRNSIATLLLPIGLASSFFFSFIGGLSLDYFGPKYTAVMGFLLQFFGWILLILANTLYNTILNRILKYTLAIVFLGFGNEPVMFSLIHSSKIFLEYKYLMIGFIVSARAFGLVIPVIIDQLLGQQTISFKNVCTAYCILQGVLIIGSFCVLPHKKDILASFEPETPIVNNNQQSNDPMAQNSSFEHRSFMSLPTTVDSVASTNLLKYKVADGMRESRAISRYVPDGTQFYISQQYQQGSHNNLKNLYEKKNKALVDPITANKENINPQINDVLVGIPYETYGSEELKFLTKDISRVEEEMSYTSSAVTQSQHWRDCSAFWIIEEPAIYLPLLPLAAISILCVTFTGNSLLHLNRSISPSHVYYLTCVPCIAASYLLQTFSPMIMLIVINTIAWLYFLLTQILPFMPFLYYFAAILGSFFTSFFLAPFYSFIAKHFPEKNFGSLLGVIIMFSGIFSVIATPMCDILSYENNYQPMNVFCLALLSVNYLILSYLYHRIRSNTLLPTWHV